MSIEDKIDRLIEVIVNLTTVIGESTDTATIAKDAPEAPVSKKKEEPVKTRKPRASKKPANETIITESPTIPELQDLAAQIIAAGYKTKEEVRALIQSHSDNAQKISDLTPGERVSFKELLNNIMSAGDEAKRKEAEADLAKNPDDEDEL